MNISRTNMVNFRDFSRGNVKLTLLYRSEGLSKLSQNDICFFMGSNIKTIVDLRGDKEREAKPDTKIDGITNISIPLSVIGEAKPVVYRGLTLPDLIDCYEQLVSIKIKDAWKQIFNILLTSKDGVLFHCSQGKDRTGVVSAVILKALGVNEEEIFKDYLLTNVHPISIVDPEEEPVSDEIKEILADYFSAKPEYLKAAFDYIDKTYGFFDAFLLECCDVDEEKHNQLKEKYLIKQ